MEKKPLKPFTVNLPEEVIEDLRILAAKQNLEYPLRVITASGLVRKVILEQIAIIKEAQNHE